MQWVADVLVATITLATELIAASWPSIILLAFAIPFARKRTLPETKLRPAAAYCIVAMFALGVAAARTIIAGEPRPPWYTDDFGNLLSADTFAHGRLSNPTHPLHRYFETLYVLQTPRYMSVYPQGQGLLLAAAQRLLGLRVAGLWVASAAASCAVAWAVAAAAPIELACVAGLLCAIHPTMMEWDGYYHAGALAAAGGALAIGGALRLASSRSATAAVAMGAGMAILANTRPYEGLIVALIACALAVRSPRGLALALAVAVAGLGFTAYYNRAVTGDPLLLPYNAYNARYLSAPNFIWQKPLPLKSYPTLEMATRYEIFRKYYERSRHLRDFQAASWIRLQEMLSAALPSSPHASWLNTLRVYAAIPLLFAWRRNRRIVAGSIVFALAILQITWWPQTHYFAPAAVLFAVLYATGVQRMIDRGDGVLAYSCVAAAFAIAIGVYCASLVQRAKPNQPRIMVTQALDARPGGQLVVADPICFDVVFNAADIDAAKIVWAHSAPDGLGPLLDYYRDREVWRLACEGNYRLEALRRPMVKGRADYERDIFYPYHFPGR